MTAALRKAPDRLQPEPLARPATRMALVSSAPAGRSPEDLLRLLYLDPHDGILVDELLAFDRK